jgi:hypothetical protein
MSVQYYGQEAGGGGGATTGAYGSGGDMYGEDAGVYRPYDYGMYDQREGEEGDDNRGTSESGCITQPVKQTNKQTRMPTMGAWRMRLPLLATMGVSHICCD